MTSIEAIAGIVSQQGERIAEQGATLAAHDARITTAEKRAESVHAKLDYILMLLIIGLVTAVWQLLVKK